MGAGVDLMSVLRFLLHCHFWCHFWCQTRKQSVGSLEKQNQTRRVLQNVFVKYLLKFKQSSSRWDDRLIWVFTVGIFFPIKTKDAGWSKTITPNACSHSKLLDQWEQRPNLRAIFLPYLQMNHWFSDLSLLKQLQLSVTSDHLLLIHLSICSNVNYLQV